MSRSQIRNLPVNILGVRRTENIEQLAKYYSMANVYVNPTSKDNFPTTNLESLACGTPVITYDTGGSTEAIDSNTGRVVQNGDINGLVNAIKELNKRPKSYYLEICRLRAKKLFNMQDRYNDYIKQFKILLDDQ